jgi:hypothetical protein
VVVLALGALLDAQPMQDALAQRLTKYKLPKREIFPADLPRNAMGKVQKNLLRERFGDLFALAIVLERKFNVLDEPALVMPTQAHPLRKPVGLPYWR